MGKVQNRPSRKIYTTNPNVSDFSKNFGKLFRQGRKEKAITQIKAARLLNTTQPSLSKKENGLNEFYGYELVLALKILGIKQMPEIDGTVQPA